MRCLGVSCNSSLVTCFILLTQHSILLPKRRKNSSYRSSQRACASHPRYERVAESSRRAWCLQSGHEHTGTALAAMPWPSLTLWNMQGQLDAHLPAEGIQPLRIP